MKSTIVHEVQDHRHRIVILNENGSNVASPWVSFNEVANNDKYFAIIGESELPQGVFTVRVVPHQVLA